MIRFILLSIFLFGLNSTLLANILDNKIHNIIDKEHYQKNINLVNVVFKDKTKYVVDDQILYDKVLRTLKENGLLHLKFSKPSNFKILFTINKYAMKSIKILNDTLKSLGYYYFFVNEVSYKEDGSLTYVISLDVESAVDPYILVSELRKHNFKILDIERENKFLWRYTIDTSFIEKRDIKYISTGEKVLFSKPLNDYFIAVDNDATTINIYSRKLNRWYPYVVFYDKSLSVVDLVKEDKIYKSAKIKIPKGTRYIKITDLFTLANIKRGLTIIIK